MISLCNGMFQGKHSLYSQLLSWDKIPGGTSLESNGCENDRHLACWLPVPKIVPSEQFVPNKVLSLQESLCKSAYLSII